MTISFVRTYFSNMPFFRDMLLSNDYVTSIGAASFTIYTRTKEYFRDHHILNRNRILDVSATGGIGYVLFFILVCILP